MKTIIALSDVHNNTSILEKLDPLFAENDYIFFLGDGLDAIRPYAQKYGKKFVCVSGNCDHPQKDIPNDTIVQVEDLKFFLTHGHIYRAEQTLLNLAYEATSKGCDVCCYGHTHNSDISKFDDLTLINGGAFYNPIKAVNSYAYIVVTGNKFVAKIVEIH